MTEVTGDRKVPWEAYVWRAAIAGGAGGLALLGLGVAYIRWRDPILPFAVEGAAIGVVFVPIAGLMMGAALGAIIWKISQKMIAEPGALARFLIGMGVVALGMLFCQTPPVPFTLTMSLLMGGLPGLAARPKRLSNSNDADTGETAVAAART